MSYSCRRFDWRAMSRGVEPFCGEGEHARRKEIKGGVQKNLPAVDGGKKKGKKKKISFWKTRGRMNENSQF